MKALISVGFALCFSLSIGAEVQSSWRSFVENSLRMGAPQDTVLMSAYTVVAYDNGMSSGISYQAMKDLEAKLAPRRNTKVVDGERNESAWPGLSAFFSDVAILGKDVATRYRGGHPVEIFGQKGTIRVSANLTFTPKKQPSKHYKFSYGIFSQKARSHRTTGPGLNFKF